MGKCQVKAVWFQKTDSLGHKISSWCKQSTTTSVYCTICVTSISCENKGFQALTQHVLTTKHKENARNNLSECQLRLKGTSGTEASCSQSMFQSEHNGTLSLHLPKDQKCIAELIWCMKNVASDMSANSCEGLADTFIAMFPGGVPEGFSLGKTKLTYLITEALGPYFYENVIKDVQHVWYTLIYDETVNTEGKKELQIRLRFWSESEEQVVVHHLETFFMGHAKAEDIAENIQQALDHAHLSMQSLLMLGSDGPNVNKKVFRIINEAVKIHRNKGLLDLGFCNIHIAHNAFLKGLHECGIAVSDLAMHIYYYFDGWPTRWDDYTQIQQQIGIACHRFIKHVPSRWLTLQAAATRLLEQWAALTHYFLKHPMNLNHKHMRDIVEILNSPVMKAELCFVVDSAEMFQDFTQSFQREEPLIHILHQQLNTLLQTLIGRACKPDLAVKQSIDIFSVENLLPVEKVVCCEEVVHTIACLSEQDHLHFLKRVQNHYVASGKYLLAKASLTLSKHFRCLQPQEIRKERSCQDIQKIASVLPLQVSTSRLVDEWKLLRLENVTSEKSERIDHYWKRFINAKNGLQEPKYPVVSKVVKAALSLSHGSADVERGFSSSGRVLSKDKVHMSVRTLNARLHIKDGMSKYKNRPECVPITKQLLLMSQLASQKYKQHLIEQRRKMQETEQKRKEEKEHEREKRELEKEMIYSKKKIEELEKEVEGARKSEEMQKKAIDTMLGEAVERLKVALEKRNLNDAQLAHGMLEGVQVLRQEERKKETTTYVLQKRIEKRKSSLITNFLKRPKI